MGNVYGVQLMINPTCDVIWQYVYSSHWLTQIHHIYMCKKAMQTGWYVGWYTVYDPTYKLQW